MNGSESQLNHSFTSDGDNCYGLEMSLVASNSIGDSVPSIFHTGHPIGMFIEFMMMLNNECSIYVHDYAHIVN